jgi:hypothetical protein
VQLEVERARHVRGETQTYTVMANSLLKNARLTAGRAMVFIEDVRANPTPAEFNDRVGKATRDMTQQIGNVKKLTGIEFHFDRGEPTGLFESLAPWADAGRRVDDHADAQAVLAEVALVEHAVNAVATWAR